jgi:AcrR family transcriptional regulator
MSTVEVFDRRLLRRDAEENRRKILDAAGEVMSEHGLGVAMQAIAARAGVGVGTLYRRFPRRSDLVEALFEDRMESIVEDAEVALDFEDGWQGLVWFLETIIARQANDKALGELLRGDPGRGRVAAIRDRLGPLGEKIVEQAKQTGRLRQDFDTTDLAMVQTMVCAVGVAAAEVRSHLWRRYLTLMIDGMVSTRESPSVQQVPPMSGDELEQVMHASSSASHGHLRSRGSLSPTLAK